MQTQAEMDTELGHITRELTNQLGGLVHTGAVCVFVYVSMQANESEEGRKGEYSKRTHSMQENSFYSKRTHSTVSESEEGRTGEYSKRTHSIVREHILL
jgi:hypothetical protein